MLLFLLVGLLAAHSSCSLRETEAEIRKQFQICKKLANNGNCDADCLGFGSFETEDCKHVQFETQNYTIIVNAHPFMHSMESWKIVRENAEKRFYRRNLTIDITEEEYRNITNHCMKLIRQQNSVFSSSQEPSIFEYCPVEVNATFFVPRIESTKVVELRKQCEIKDNNGVCDLMCRGFEGFKNYEEKDCADKNIPWHFVYGIPIFSTKQDLLRPLEFWRPTIEATLCRIHKIQITHHHAFRILEEDVREHMLSSKKYLERNLFLMFDYSENSTFLEYSRNWYVARSEARIAHSEEELKFLRIASDKHL